MLLMFAKITSLSQSYKSLFFYLIKFINERNNITFASLWSTTVSLKNVFLSYKNSILKYTIIKNYMYFRMLFF